MRGGAKIIGLGLFVFLAIATYWPNPAEAQQGRGVQWIWANEGDPLKSAPAEARYFRRTFDLGRTSDETMVDITADKEFTLWVNGVKVGQGSDPKRVYRFDVNKHIGPGKNVIAVEAKGSGGPSGLLARVSYIPNGQSGQTASTDATWKTAKTADAGWQKADFNDAKWTAAKVLGAFGKTGPWKGLVWDAGGDDRFSVPPGFRVELVVKDPYEPANPMEKRKKAFSLINMCFDNKGRLLLSEEGGPILLCTQPDQNGIFQKVTPYCEQVKSSQGMCWVKDALLLVGNGPQGTGLYRVKDTKGTDQTDQVECLHKFRGGMGEHGPHAIIHGPDDWLYVVIGNHASAQVGPKAAPNPDKLAAHSPLLRWPTGGAGPDQGKPGTTEDVLLPRQNDSRGHAANILAPGGTIWRMDQQGQNLALVTAGFRNHYDASFSPNGELFTFDSDMEWDEGLPWYRHVRVCHCPPGADFVWRTGAANTPDYYLDSLPPLAETGRGSPVGTEFYDHVAFPEKYRGAYFMADWAIGTIFVVYPERVGASYKGKFERFCSGAPMNVTDLAVGPDGAMYFTMGGRGTQGSVYRIVYGKDRPAGSTPLVQKDSAWGRRVVAEAVRQQTEGLGKERFLKEMTDFLLEGKPTHFHRSLPSATRLDVLHTLQNHGFPPQPDLLLQLVKDKDAAIRAEAVLQLGVNASAKAPVVKEALVHALKDDDALNRRRACEALIRAGIEPPVEALWPLLADKDRWVRTAARLVLQRIDLKQWAERLWKEDKDIVAWEGIIALCKINQAGPYAEQIFNRLNRPSDGTVEAQLNHVRTIQMALIHAGSPGASTPGSPLQKIAEKCVALFPQKDKLVNRELAILLSHFRKEGIITSPVHSAILNALLASEGDRQQQIHYFYCLRFLHQGWSAAEKQLLLAWFDTAKTWTGGHSFGPFLDNILRDANPAFTAEDRVNLLAQIEKYPRAATALFKLAPSKEMPAPKVLAEMYDKLAKSKPGQTTTDLKAFVIEGLAQSDEPAAQAALRKIGDQEPAQRDTVAKALARNPTAENFPYIARGLQSTSQPLLVELVNALRKVPAKPKADDPAPFRSLLLASENFGPNPKQRWLAVELLRHWTGRNFGAEKPEQWKDELTSFSRWFSQSFPKEPPLPNVTAETPSESKWKFDELLAFLDKDPAGKGDPVRGRLVFEKAQCIKCHKYGKEGEGIGPDLTEVRKRFKRSDHLEAILYPSKVISDQYRSTLIVTRGGQIYNGLAAPQGDVVTILLQDASKVTIKKDDIEQQVASLVSVMPEKLLDMLTKQEIADLFAFMESEVK